MKPEIELIAIPIDSVDVVATVLLALGGLGFTPEKNKTLHRRTTFRRAGVHIETFRGRVRDEGDKITMTVKRVTDVTMTGTLETEVQVSDYAAGCAFMLANDWIQVSTQENYRTTWRMGQTQLMLDEWPGLIPFFEIEGETADAVRQIAYQLGFEDRAIIVGGTVANVYEEVLGIPRAKIWELPQITFATPPTRA